MPEEESPKRPDGLEMAGRRLWDSVTATFTLNAGEIAILGQACCTADEITLLEAELREAPFCMRCIGVSSGRPGWVATHRRPLVVGPPLELQVFRGDDWISGDGVSPYWAWLMARFEWCRDHPNDFSLGGDEIDMLRARAAYKRGLYP